MKLLLDRSDYEDSRTIGDLYVDGVFECVTLEDELAVNGLKIPGHTCIPEGVYTVLITPSPKFKRLMPLLVGVPGFDGIRIHPGIDESTTEGCLQVGESIERKPITFLLHSKSAFDRLYAKLAAAVGKGESISIEVTA